MIALLTLLAGIAFVAFKFGRKYRYCVEIGDEMGEGVTIVAMVAYFLPFLIVAGGAALYAAISQ